MLDSSKIRIGLALGSGAARGWAHIGVLQALAKLRVQPDIICGTSIGALVGGFHLSGNLHTLEAWARQLTKLKLLRYLDFRLTGNGLIAGDRLFGEMARHVGDHMIENFATPFASVVTDLDSGHEIWLTQGRLIDALRASFSLPAFFEPVKLGDRWLIDGALVNPVPVSVCRALGARVVIAVNLNSSAPPRPQPSAEAGGDAGARAGAQLNGAQSVAREVGRGLDFLRLRTAPRDPTTPSRLGVMAATLNIVQDRITRSRLAADPPEINIVPKVGHIGLLEFHRTEELIEAGRSATLKAAEDIGGVFGHVVAHRS